MRAEYEGFKREPSWSKNPSPGYLDATVEDLRSLTADLQSEALLVDVFEVMWPQRLLARAVDELADLGRPIRHLYYVSDAMIQQVANAMEDEVDVTRQRMLEAVDLVPTDVAGYIVWDR